MNHHRYFNIDLALFMGACLAILGPALDDPHETPAAVAQAARNAADADGVERLTRICQARHGMHAEVRWTGTGQPVCARFSSGGEMVGMGKRP